MFFWILTPVPRRTRVPLFWRGGSGEVRGGGGRCVCMGPEDLYSCIWTP